MKNKRKISNKILGVVLSVVFTLQSLSLQVMAAPVPSDIYADDICVTNISNNGTATIDGEDVVSFNGKADPIAKGTYYGLAWTLSSEGELIIKGKYDEQEEGTFWGEHASDILTAKVIAGGVKSTQDWFANLSKLKSVDLNAFDSGNVRNMSGMFYGCSSLETVTWSVPETHNVKDMSYLFYGCESLENINVSSFDTAKVTNMRYMFGNCSSLTKLNVSGFDTGNVTDMSGMFQNCGKVAVLNVANFDTGNVTDMSYMFADCYALKNLNVSGFDTADVTNMSSMFQNCSRLEKLNLKNFQTDKVEHMSAMFYGCGTLVALDLSNFNTSSVTNMAHMFRDCRELAKVDLSSFDTTKVTNADYMFYKCYKLQALDLSDFYLVRLTSAQDMLGRCGALEQIETPVNLTITIDLPFTMQTKDLTGYEELPQNKYVSLTLETIKFQVAAIGDQVYTGEFIKPEVKVTGRDGVLVMGEDYTLSYKYNKNVAETDSEKVPTVFIKGKGKYKGTLACTFSITPKEITEENIEVGDLYFHANKKVQKRKPVICVDGRQLKVGKDYTVEYPDTATGAYKEPGCYPVLIKGKGNYQGEYTTSITILGEGQILASDLSVGRIAACTYVKGTPATPVPKITYEGKTLELNKDYAISYRDNDKVGQATLVIVGLENEEGQYICGTVEKTFKIKGTSLKRAEISYKDKVLYTGYGIYPEVKVVLNGVTLVKNEDYTVECTNNVNVGKAKLVITGCGGYSGTIRRTFRIQPDTGVSDMLSYSLEEGAIVPYSKDGSEPEVIVNLDGKILQKDVDYTISYRNNTQIAKADGARAPYVVLKGIGNYRFNKTIHFTIVEKDLNDTDISIEVADKIVGDKNPCSKPIIWDSNGKKLKLNTDYTIVGYKIDGVDYNPDRIPLHATRGIVTVKGKGHYTGEVSVMYCIAEKNIADTEIIAKDLEYTGQSVEYTVDMLNMGALLIVDQETHTELSYGTDYEIMEYKNNTKKGTATVTVKGIGDYGGVVNVKFNIVRKSLDS